jgi:hypothetical protein
MHQSGKKPIFTFKKDGTGTWSGQPCTWEVEGDEILVKKGDLVEKISTDLDPKGTYATGTKGKQYTFKQFK